MMKRIRMIMITAFLTVFLPVSADGSTTLLQESTMSPRQRLDSLFVLAEQCYLTDDLEQLSSYMESYDQLYNQFKPLLGDSADVYNAYYCKMAGDYYYSMAEEAGIYAKWAESYYRKGLSVFSKRNSERNVITLREELAQLFYKIRDYELALLQLDSIFDYYDNRLNTLQITSYEVPYYRTLSQLAICHARLKHFDLALQQIAEARDYFKKQKGEFYYEILRRQGKILMLQADILGTTRYKEAKQCYEQYVNEECSSIAQRLDTMSAAHRAQHWLATHRFLYDCYRLGGHAPELLYDLALFSKGYLLAYENNHQTEQVRWEQVRKKLKAQDCAIEFVQYFGKKDEKRMGCLVLRNSGKPQFIDLFATDSVLSLKLTYPYTVANAFEASDPTIKDTLYRDTRLQQLIWSPQLMNAIGNANRVYFAPDGLIHQWAIEYLIPDSQKVCYRLSSTRNLVQRHAPLRLQSGIFCGGIAYRAKYRPTGEDNDFIAYRYLKSKIGDVINLPYTKIEVDSIYACRNNPNDTLLSGDVATDERLLQLLKKKEYDIVHLTTHGHFIGKIDIKNDLRPLSDDLSLSRCGLIFAGAANVLSDKNFDDHHFDALLSGTEIAQQDFSQTELVVCNACQTGQGRLTEDGIYGLQRALKQGGANAMIVSLWNLYDYSSCIFLRYFYEELQQQAADKDLHAAFLTARERLMAHERTDYALDEATLGLKYVVQRYDAPRHVNPFIIIDAY